MATSDELLAAAKRVESAADEIRSLVKIRGAENGHGISGGSLQRQVEQSFELAQGLHQQAANQLDEAGQQLRDAATAAHAQEERERNASLIGGGPR